MNAMESGLCSGNYYDYAGDDVALQREIELMDGREDTFTDVHFPPDIRSLYFDPLNPPKG